jgi:hypothetical protein
MPIEAAGHDDPYLMGAGAYVNRLRAFLHNSNSE